MASATFPIPIGGDGSTVDDTTSATTGLDNGGHRTRLVPAFTNIINIAQYMINLLTAALNGAATSATSTTSLLIGTGTKALTLAQTGKGFAIGQTVVIASTAGATNQMLGVITAFNSGTGAMTVEVSSVSGSGTLADWTIAVSASAGVASSRSVNTSGLASGGGNLSADRTIAVTAAAASDMRAGTSNVLAVTPLALANAMPPVAAAYSATETLDFSTGFNFDIASLTGNMTLANPTNMKVGQSGRIRIPQDATGSRIISYGSWWKGAGGAQALTTTANAVDTLIYYVKDASTIEYNLLRAFA
jgi:hypothetical protein